MSLRITPTMLHSIDNCGRIEEVSEQWLATLGYGYDEVIGRLSTDFLSEESARYARDVVLPAFFLSGTCDVEYEMRRKDGVLIPVHLSGVAIRNESGTFLRSIAVIEDLTERRALERKIFEAQKLESLGLMAGNIAHDFNNLLASVVGNAQLALHHAGHIPAATSSLHDILTAASRAAGLCQQLLAYSGRGRFQIEQLDLDDLVSEMVKVLEVSVGKHAVLELDLMKRGTCVEVDATQIRQIVMNLVINAAEAMEGRVGSVKIRTARDDLDEAMIAASAHPDVKPGRYICLEVADHGCGMTPATLAQIFDPFFSTKTRGRGLGLAAVHGIVRGHHGTLQVHTVEGQGTSFKIYLPAVEPRPASPWRDAAAIRAHRGTVLVVDDDDLLRRTLAGQLEEAGYQVLVASSGVQAMELALTAEIAAFLIDVTMPGISGPELVGRLQRALPDAHIVLMSGYDRVDLPASMRTKCLQKPFTEDELLRAIDRP